MPILGIPDEFLYKLRKGAGMNRPLMESEIEELKQMLDGPMYNFVGIEPEGMGV